MSDNLTHTFQVDSRDLMQFDLFPSMVSAYAAADGAIKNDQLYDAVVKATGADPASLKHRVPVDKAGVGPAYSLAKRKVRWHQQSLRQLGLIHRVGRGLWEATPKARELLTPAKPKTVMIAFSTKLGVALWASNKDVLAHINEPIHLCLTSPPYCLAQPRAYGNPSVADYVDFLCEAMEPVVKNLVDGGSVALNVSNDIFEPKSPARSLYLERLTIALHDRLGLSLMDRIIWQNLSKPPGPMQWASRTRQQLNTSFEHVLWLTNDPKNCFSDNRRVLQPHSVRQQRLLARGGEKRVAEYGDGAYKLREGSFGKPTEGAIPKNILSFGHRCFSQDVVRQFAKDNGLPVHGATFPLKLAKFLVEFLSRKDDLVVDLFAGWATTGLAAEETGRRWLCIEKMREYVQASPLRFKDAPGFRLETETA